MMIYSLASRVYLPECQVFSTCQVYPYTEARGPGRRERTAVAGGVSCMSWCFPFLLFICYWSRPYTDGTQLILFFSLLPSLLSDFGSRIWELIWGFFFFAARVAASELLFCPLLSPLDLCYIPPPQEGSEYIELSDSHTYWQTFCSASSRVWIEAVGMVTFS